MSSFNQLNCFGCGEPIDDVRCRWCTCERCGYDLRDGFCLFCNSRDGNSFAYDPNPNSFNDSQNLSDYPPQPQYQTYSCGYDCPPQVSIVYNQELCFNQNFDNNFPQTSSSFPQQYLCCENCGGPHESFQCQPMNQNFYNSSGFDQFQPPQYPVIHHPPQETSKEILQARENLMKSIQTFLKKFNRISFRETPKVLTLAWEKFFEIQHAQPEDIQELLHKLLKDLQIIREELAEYINSPSWNLPTSSYDDDDDEYSFATQEYLMTCSTAITPDSPKTDSLIMVDKHLDTIPEMESDEFIKSSVENLVQNPRESEDECECDVPDCDDSQTTNFSTFSNPLFDDSTSSDDESSHEEVIHEISFKTYSNPLFDLDEEIISSEFNPINNEDIDSTPKNDCFDTEPYLLESLLNRDTLMASSPKIDSLLDEFANELITIPLRIVNREHGEYISLMERLLYDNSSPRLPEDFHANPNTFIESLPIFPIHVEDNDSLMEEIDLFLDPDDSIPPDDRIFFDFEPDMGVLTAKVVEDISEYYVLMPKLLPTQPTLCPDIDTLLPFSSKNEDQVFNPGILSSNLLSYLGKITSDFSENPMMICGEDIPILDVPYLHFYPP
ncbi:hypothetical protein Tco_0803098 [Tanacetum coccineum]|uniref:Pre-mRNA splicing Prp18-interacting factor n=1 Tax=Tanacetum coccineum TaxID=301880 RepID=A0ABQ5A4Q2_9ASTR